MINEYSVVLQGLSDGDYPKIQQYFDRDDIDYLYMTIGGLLCLIRVYTETEFNNFIRKINSAYLRDKYYSESVKIRGLINRERAERALSGETRQTELLLQSL